MALPLRGTTKYNPADGRSRQVTSVATTAPDAVYMDIGCEEVTFRSLSRIDISVSTALSAMEELSLVTTVILFDRSELNTPSVALTV